MSGCAQFCVESFSLFFFLSLLLLFVCFFFFFFFEIVIYLKIASLYLMKPQVKFAEDMPPAIRILICNLIQL